MNITPLNLGRGTSVERGDLMDIEGPLNLVELYVKCCMSRAFSGEMVQRHSLQILRKKGC